MEDKNKIQKCECPIDDNVTGTMEKFYSEEEKSGMNHKPGECKGTYDLKRYKRDDRKLWLCSCCSFSGDVEIT